MRRMLRPDTEVVARVIMAMLALPQWKGRKRHKHWSLNFSHFVARHIWRRHGVSPRCCRVYRLHRRESLRYLLVPMTTTVNLLQTPRN